MDIGRIRSIFAVSFFIAMFLFCTAIFAMDLPVAFQDEKTGLHGFKNRNGEEVIPCKYVVAYQFNEFGVAAVFFEGKWLYIDQDGDPVVESYMFDNGPDYHVEGLARYVSRGKIGFINEAAEIIIPAQFEFAFPFSDGMALFCEGCKKMKTGEHTAVVGGKWGYVNKKGEIAVSAMYDGAYSFSDGRAVVTLGDASFYIDKKGKRLEE